MVYFFIARCRSRVSIRWAPLTTQPIITAPQILIAKNHPFSATRLTPPAKNRVIPFLLEKNEELGFAFGLLPKIPESLT